MQNELIQPPSNLPDVTPAPMVEVLLLEDPWLLMAAAAVLGIVLTLFFIRRKKMAIAILMATEIVTFPLVIWFVAHSVQTDREILKERATSVVEAVAAWDAAALDPLVSERAQTIFFQAPQGWDKDRLLEWIRSNGSRFALSNYEITDIRAETGPVSTAGRTRVQVRVTPTSTDRPTGFICMISWIYETDAAGGTPTWRVDTIEPLWVQGYGDLRPR